MFGFENFHVAGCCIKYLIRFRALQEAQEIFGMDLDMEMLEEESDGEEYDEQDDEVSVSYQVVPYYDVT